MSEYRTFAVPYDFSEHARAALQTAVDLARRLAADLHLVHVVQHPIYAYGGVYSGAQVPPPADRAAVREAAAESLRDVARGIADPPGRVETHVFEGPGVADILQEAAGKLGADLLVMGTHGRTGLAHVFLGSVTERTLRGAPCPVLAVRAPEEDAR